MLNTRIHFTEIVSKFVQHSKVNPNKNITYAISIKHLKIKNFDLAVSMLDRLTNFLLAILR